MSVINQFRVLNSGALPTARTPAVSSYNLRPRLDTYTIATETPCWKGDGTLSPCMYLRMRKESRLPIDVPPYPIDPSVASWSAEGLDVRDRLGHSVDTDLMAISRLEAAMCCRQYCLEPQVAWAAQTLSLKGYAPHTSGFSPELDDQLMPGRDHYAFWHDIGLFELPLSPQEQNIVNSAPGAFYDSEGGRLLVSGVRRSLGDVKRIFDDVARRLPNRGHWFRVRCWQEDSVFGRDNAHAILLDRSYSGWQALDWGIFKRMKMLIDCLKSSQLTATSSVVAAEIRMLKDDNMLQSLLREAMISGAAVILSGYDAQQVNEIVEASDSGCEARRRNSSVHPGFRLLLRVDNLATLASYEQALPTTPIINYLGNGLVPP